MEKLVEAIAQRADMAHLVLTLVVVGLFALLREQAKRAEQAAEKWADAMARLTEVITQLRIERAVDRAQNTGTRQ